MSVPRISENYTVWKRIGLTWLPLRTYLSEVQALELARDWATDGCQYRVTKATGTEVKRFGKAPRPIPLPPPSVN